MTSVQFDSVDDLLFDMYKKQVLKDLRSKMPPDMLSVLSILKDGGVCNSDIGSHISKLECFLASMVSGQDGKASYVPECSLSALKYRLESEFGAVLSNEVISGLVNVFAVHSSKMPSIPSGNENLVIDLVNFLVGASCIKTKGSEFVTPTSKRKNVSMKSPIAPVKRVGKLDPHNIDAKALFPEVLGPDIEVISVIDAPAITTKQLKKDDDVVFVKELSLSNKLTKLCKSSEAVYNKGISMRSKVDVEGATTLQTPHSPSLSIVSGFRVNVADVGLPVPDSAKFPVSFQEKMVYNAVCSLAKGKHANTTVVDIGGCILKYFSFGESMIAGNQVCTFVINVFCRKFFMDVRPSVSKKHYFFSGISEVFLSESPDYSSVKKSFNRAGSVLPLPTCELLFFPVLSAKHWFLLVVDMGRKLFVFLDSYYSKDDGFSLYTRSKLIKGFLAAWEQFVGPTTRFREFKAAYPHVPKQANEVDCGIFLIKFMEFWGNVMRMTDMFAQEDIPSIRVKIVNELLYSKHNTADINAVNEFIAQGTGRI